VFKKYFPILVWIKHYTYDDFASDTVAAIVVTIMLIPQSLAYALLAGLDHNRYAGHSLRSGFATSTAETGADERSIMAMTGHKTTQMVRRYIQESNLFKNNALNKIKI